MHAIVDNPEAAAHCTQIVERAHSNFALAFRSLSAERQRAMRALYAFCRVIDDIADEPGAAAAKRARLIQWHTWIDDLPAAPDLVAQELAWAQRTYVLPLRPMHELIDGVAFDVDGRTPQTWDELEQYCYGVAGTVGLLCLPIFGVDVTSERVAGAVALGLAFQLTNIARDVASDARGGRCYLPAHWLAAHGLTAAMISAAAGGDAAAQRRVTPALREFAARAEAAYRAAWRAFPIADTPQMEPARIMSFCYYRILLQILRRPLVIFLRRVSVPWTAKIRLLLRAVTGRGWLGLWFT